jgi:cyclopropane fatty-acyl-phospholipid synthase-like methyltransferase
MLIIIILEKLKNWNSEQSQHLRFNQLEKIITVPQDFSLCDFGCGYGAFYDYLKQKYPQFDYLGLDISSTMLEHAKKMYPQGEYVLASEIPRQVDYVVASGIFNLSLTHDKHSWSDYVRSVLDHFNQMTTRGFAFNCLTSFSDKEYMKENLYYANPGEMFNLCKEAYSKNVALLHDYELYEFTILVRK